MSQPKNALRLSQLITTFGPGAMVDLPRLSALVAGLEHWIGAAAAPRVIEPRLSKKLAADLGVPDIELRSPPLPSEDWHNAPAGVKAFRFPEWFLTQQSEFLGEGGARSRRLLHRKSLHRGKYRDADGKLRPVVPVRFVRACPAGHIDDLDWYDFAHHGAAAASACRAGGRALYLDERGTSSHLSEELVRCECGAPARSLVEATIFANKPLGMCNGKRPWLGPASREQCHHPFRLLIRSASNAYFSMTQSVISLPDRGEKVKAAVDAVWETLVAAKTRENLHVFMTIPKIREALRELTEEEVWEEIEARALGSGSSPAPVRHAEMETLMRVPEGNGSPAAFETVFSARALPPAEWAAPAMAPVMAPVERVVLVDRLREVVAQYGFTRFDPITLAADGDVDDRGIQRAALSTELRWLPAFENRGEGIFLQLSPAALEAWRERPAVTERVRQLMLGFQAWKRERPQSQRQFPGAAYVLLHSLSHLLMTTLSLLCGYPSTALRERVYACEGLGYGVLIYTGAADAEGTLGGLVEAGRGIAGLMREALEMARLCSNDPVCAQHVPERAAANRYLQGAACHGCLLLPETSCEMHNDFLDRQLVVATLEASGAEMFAGDTCTGASHG